MVRIERETGRVTLDRMIVVDDIGTVVNPLIVYGQIMGGLTQGIAEALTSTWSGTRRASR